MKSFLRFWFPVWAYSAIIFYLSSLPGSQVSGIPVWDKLLHGVAYGGLGVLYARAFSGTRVWPNLSVWVLSVVCCYLYGLSDEFHQSFTPGRASGLDDALADFVGGAFGAGLYLIVGDKIKKVQVK